MRYFNQIILLLSFWIVMGIQIHAQTVQIIDAETQSPLPYALVYSTDGTYQASADINGKLTLPPELNTDSLYIQQIGYEKKGVPFTEMDMTIALNSKQLSLDEIVVSANRWEQRKSEISAYVQRVDPKKIELLQPQTTADLISGDGLVFVQKSQMGGGSPMIRGFATNRVLLVVDGIRMNNAIFRSGNLQNIISIDPYTVEQAEVLFGPSSVIYGSDAIGGVMDFHTIEAQIDPQKKFNLNGQANLRHSTANQELSGHVSTNYGNEKWQGVTSFSYSRFGDLKMGRFGRDRYLRDAYQARIDQRDTLVENKEARVQRPTGYSQYNFMQKLNLRLQDGVKLESAFIYTQTSDIPRYDRLIQMRNGEPRSAEWYYGPQKWNLAYLQFSSANATVAYDHLDIRLAYQFFEESRNDRAWQDNWLRNRTERVYAPSLNIDLDKEIGRWKLFYGLDIAYNHIRSDAKSTNILNNQKQNASTRYPDASDWLSAALYLSGRYSIDDDTHINAGIRGNYIHVYAPLNNFDFPLPFEDARLRFGNISGSLGIISKIAEGQRIFINLSTGFRAPNIDDIGKIFDSEPGSVVVPNSNLRPEYAYNADLGYTLIINENFKLESNFFATWLDNAMVRRDFNFDGQDSISYDGTLSQVQAIQNASTGYVLGGQLGLTYSPVQHWTFEGRISYQYGRSTESTGDERKYEPLRHAAPLFGQVGLTFEKRSWLSGLQLAFNGEITHDNLAPSERAKPHLYALNNNGDPFSPGWHRLDWRLQKKWGALTTTIAVENISNQRYRTYSSGIVAAGLNFVFSAAYSF